MSKALELFTATPKLHNCAQAVAGGFDRDDLVAELATQGGGKAPEGRCGALHAAMLLAGDNQDRVREEFIAELGSEQCIALKRELKVPCAKCVEIGEKLANKYKQ